MDLKEYKKRVEDTWITKKENKDVDEIRIVLGICGESGEIAEKYKKSLRGDSISNEAIKKEIGDVLYYIMKLCNVNEWNLEDILQDNINKLAKRQKENKIQGSGDDRENE